MRLQNQLPPQFGSWLAMLLHVTSTNPELLDGREVCTQPLPRDLTTYVIDIAHLKANAGEEAINLIRSLQGQTDDLYRLKRELMDGLFAKYGPGAESEMSKYKTIVDKMMDFSVMGK